MANLFMSIICGVLSFYIYAFSNDLISVNRLVTNIPLSLVEQSVDLVHSDGEKLFFNQLLLKFNFSIYFRDNITKYVEDYELTFTFLNSQDKSICIGDKCDAVTIDVVAHIKFNYEFTRSLSYEIWRKPQ